ncbi:MAG TPA: helix-turn-helix transcriptional regulator [Kribbella sp.]|nr:helix-turn-helix transcriptional regulator [Kribbella sp.]
MSATTTDGMHPDVSELEITKVLAALGDQGRLLTVRALDRLGDSDCTRLQADAGLTMSRSTFSHHQKVLREAGILHARIQGSQRILSLRRADLNTRFPGLLDAVLDPPA